MRLNQMLITAGVAASVGACGEPTSEPVQPTRCDAVGSVLQCLDSELGCDWYASGCAPSSDGAPPELQARYSGEHISLPEVGDVDTSWFTVHRRSDGSYLGVLAFQLENTSIVFPAEVAVSPGGAVILETTGLECIGDLAPCESLADGRFGGRVEESRQIFIDDYATPSLREPVGLHFVPHDGVKPAPPEQNSPPIDLDPVAGKYEGQVLVRTNDGFVSTGCSFLISGTQGDGYFIEDANCPVGTPVPDTLAFDADWQRFWFQLDSEEGRLTFVGEIALEQPPKDDLQLQGLFVRDQPVLFFKGGPPRPLGEVPVSQVAGTATLPETGVAR